MLFAWSISLILLLSLRQVFILLKNRMLLAKIQQKEQQLNLKNMELQKLNEQILRDAQIDFLTQLSNRRYIEDAFERLAPQTELMEHLGLLLIDVDHFKTVNDTFGHQVGDKVLQSVAEKIRRSIRAHGIAGRYGGDEFIVLLPGATTQAVMSVAKRLQKHIREDHSLQEWRVTVSIGASSLGMNKDDYEIGRLLRNADDALYQAKDNGRNQVCMASTENLVPA
ncbi:MAG: GGDEF domain-containing protein [Desulfovibrio sp.]|nr:GGDEF domain-containing protein [Desulfovibrio sp.]